MREAIRSIQTSSIVPAFVDIIAPTNRATSDTGPDHFIHDATFLYAHGVRIISTSPFGANFGIIDPDLRAKKVDSGPRIVDVNVCLASRIRCSSSGCCLCWRGKGGPFN
ncbi:hypothetical protein BDZ94DRAFT_389812 [Collybia nuda]|uniref:Uncharacterized protein n=1 Tax=Collybia nuda TaxID=64659 RepID=A0A9P5YCF1_9AGAR|nr:hypothetical protein BDZ94DRAFT_389812 [Collybia nuda]